MNKVLLMPDSFKGSLSATEICAILEQCVLNQFPDCQVVSMPMADGGEGTVDCFLRATGGQRVPLQVCGPLFTEVDAFYARLDETTAAVEMAACAGLPLLRERERNPLLTTTYGVGQLIGHAVANGCTQVIVGIGGSATNDGGTGMAAALGVQFFDRTGETFIPTGGTLVEIDRIDASGVPPAVRSANFTAMCDIDNPLCGPQGASHVFAPQKGADSATVEKLETGLLYLAEVVRRDLGLDIAHLPGAGAAGGLGGGLVAFLGARLRMGAETCMDTLRFEAQARGADLILTGEGSLDSQSLRGKVVVSVGRRAKALGIPVVAIVGGIQPDLSLDDLRAEGVTAAFSTTSRPQSLPEAMTNAAANLRQAAGHLLAVLALGEKGGKL